MFTFFYVSTTNSVFPLRNPSEHRFQTQSVWIWWNFHVFFSFLVYSKAPYTLIINGIEGWLYKNFRYFFFTCVLTVKENKGYPQTCITQSQWQLFLFFRLEQYDDIFCQVAHSKLVNSQASEWEKVRARIETRKQITYRRNRFFMSLRVFCIRGATLGFLAAAWK